MLQTCIIQKFKKLGVPQHPLIPGIRLDLTAQSTKILNDHYPRQVLAGEEPKEMLDCKKSEKPVPIPTSHEWCRMARIFHGFLLAEKCPESLKSEGYGLFNLPRWIQVRHPVLRVGFAPVVFENLKSILWWGILLKLKVGQWYPTEEIEISLHIVRYLWLGKVHTWQKLALRKSCTISANDSILIDSVRTRLSILKDMFSQPLQLQLQILPSKSFDEGPSWSKPCMSSANVASSRSRSWPQKSATMGWTIGSAHAHEARRCFFRLIFNVNSMDV